MSRFYDFKGELAAVYIIFYEVFIYVNNNINGNLKLRAVT